MLLRKIGKRNRERVVPFSDTILKLLRETWSIHRHQQWIFPHPNGSAITEKRLAATIRVARAECGFGDEFTAHVLRHSFATRLLEQGVAIETIQLLLGHASRCSTQIYLHMTQPLQDDVRRKINSFADDLGDSKGGAK